MIGLVYPPLDENLLFRTFVHCSYRRLRFADAALTRFLKIHDCEFECFIKALFIYQGFTKALSRLYQGFIKALSRLYQGFIKDYYQDLLFPCFSKAKFFSQSQLLIFTVYDIFTGFQSQKVVL